MDETFLCLFLSGLRFLNRRSPHVRLPVDTNSASQPCQRNVISLCAAKSHHLPACVPPVGFISVYCMFYVCLSTVTATVVSVSSYRNQQVDAHLLWERPRWTDVENLRHVLRVALLSHVTQFGCDVDPSADVHVHPPGFLLNLGVQFRHLLHGDGKRFDRCPSNSFSRCVKSWMHLFSLLTSAVTVCDPSVGF